VLQGLDAIDALEYYLSHPEERQALRDDIARLNEVSERARVGNDLEAARAEAGRIVSDAHAQARTIVAEADKHRAQAEEVLSNARKQKDSVDADAGHLKAAIEANAREAERVESLRIKRKVELDERERALVIRDNQNRQEADRLRAWNTRLETALKGP
jgi:F0F1-type ATP synthase membrane subunit b/b'